MEPASATSTTSYQTIADQTLTNFGSIAFNTPSEMQLRERRVIQLLLDPQLTPGEVEKKVTEAGKVESARIRISETVEAHLTGSAFEIRPVTPEVQAVSGRETTEWKWEILPLEEGTLRLFLTVNALIPGREGEKRSIRTFDRAIIVRVVPNRVAEALRWLVPVAVILIVAAAVFLMRSRRRKQSLAETAIFDAGRTPIAPTQRITGESRIDTERYSAPAFRIGDLIADRYRITQILGRGGMGVVYAAEDRELGNDLVALKTVLPAVAGTQTMDRFRREIQLARRVHHRNVCRVFDLGRHVAGSSEVLFVTMELVEGQTLASLVDARKRLSREEALPLIRQMADGVQAIHECGMVHRDLKTSNVMVTEPGSRVVIMDFGLALDLEGKSFERLTRTGASVGTPLYMAPEQFERGDVSPASDIYAFGLILYEMLTGRFPFDGDTPLSILAKRLHEPPVPPSARDAAFDPYWEAVILKCLERDPQQRYQSMPEVIEALTQAAAAR